MFWNLFHHTSRVIVFNILPGRLQRVTRWFASTSKTPSLVDTYARRIRKIAVIFQRSASTFSWKIISATERHAQTQHVLFAWGGDASWKSSAAPTAVPAAEQHCRLWLRREKNLKWPNGTHKHNTFEARGRWRRFVKTVRRPDRGTARKTTL